MKRTLPAVGALVGAVACAASYTGSFSAGVATASSSEAASSFVSPSAGTAQVDRSAPPASVVPSAESLRGLQLVPNNTLAAAALSPSLLSLQQKRFPSGRPTGEALGGMLSQGQGIQLEAKLQPERCYALLGYSPSLSVFSLEFSPRQGEPILVRAVDGVGVLDGSPCLRVSSEQSVVLRVVALVGAGPVVVQLYER